MTTLATACRVRLMHPPLPDDVERSHSCAELKQLCERHEVAKSGTKADMAERIRLRIYDDNETAEYRASVAQAMLLEQAGRKLTKAEDVALVAELDRRVRDREERQIRECELGMDEDLFSRCGDDDGSRAFFFRKKKRPTQALCRVVRTPGRLRGFMLAPSWKMMVQKMIRDTVIKNDDASHLLLAMGVSGDYKSKDFASPIWWV